MAKIVIRMFAHVDHKKCRLLYYKPADLTTIWRKSFAAERAVVVDLGSSGIELRRDHVGCAQYGARGSFEAKAVGATSTSSSDSQTMASTGGGPTTFDT